MLNSAPESTVFIPSRTSQLTEQHERPIRSTISDHVGSIAFDTNNIQHEKHQNGVHSSFFKATTPNRNWEEGIFVDVDAKE